MIQFNPLTREEIINTEQEEEIDSRNQEKKSKKRKTQQIILKQTDYLILYALYRHRKLNAQQVYTLVFNGKTYYDPHKGRYMSSYHPRSLIRRLGRLLETDFIRQDSYLLTYITEVGETVQRKVPYYRLTDKGLEVVIARFFGGQRNEKWDEYNLDNKYYIPVREMNVRNMEHHNALQNVVTRAIDLVIQQHKTITDFTQLVYGDGKRFRLFYGVNHLDQPLHVIPDFLFFSVNDIRDEDRYYLEWCTMDEAEAYLLKNKPRIVLEEDTGEQDLDKIVKKHRRYLKHLQYFQSFYEKHPLIFVYSVKNNLANILMTDEVQGWENEEVLFERQRRIVNLKQYVQMAFDSLIKQGIILPYVVDDLRAPGLLSQFILGRNKPDLNRFVEVINKAIEQISGYRFKRVFQDFKPEMNCSVNYLLEFESPENERDTINIFIQGVMPGDVQAEVTLIETAKWLHHHQKSGLIIAVMENEYQLKNEAFYLRHDHSGQDSKLLNYIFFTTPDVFEENEQGWVVGPNPQRKGIVFRYLQPRKLVRYFV